MTMLFSCYATNKSNSLRVSSALSRWTPKKPAEFFHKLHCLKLLLSCSAIWRNIPFQNVLEYCFFFQQTQSYARIHDSVHRDHWTISFPVIHNISTVLHHKQCSRWHKAILMKVCWWERLSVDQSLLKENQCQVFERNGSKTLAVCIFVGNFYL